MARRSHTLVRRRYAVLTVVSNWYPPLSGSSLYITHPSAARSENPARLACVRPAASVQSEPWSNSSIKVLSVTKVTLSLTDLKQFCISHSTDKFHFVKSIISAHTDDWLRIVKERALNSQSGRRMLHFPVFKSSVTMILHLKTHRHTRLLYSFHRVKHHREARAPF